MKIGNIGAIDHQGNYELSEVMAITGDVLTVKVLRTGDTVRIYNEEIIILVDGI